MNRINIIIICVYGLPIGTYIYLYLNNDYKLDSINLVKGHWISFVLMIVI
jgi:hypothetical protein